MNQQQWQPDDRWSVVAAANLWLVIPLMVLPEGFNFARLTATTTAGSTEGGNTVSHLLWLSALGCSGVVVLWRSALAKHVLARLNPWYLLLLVLAGLSLGWSIDPGLTVRRLVRVLAIVSCLTALMCTGWHDRRLQSVLRPLVTALLLGSLVFGLGWPQYAIHGETSQELLGAWRGLTSHKNALGGLAATGCLLWCHAGMAGEVSRRKSIAGFCIGLMCLLLSRSTTSLLATLCTCGFLVTLLPRAGRQRRWLPKVAVPVLIASLVLGLGSVSSVTGLSIVSAPVALLAGKDGSLTGRTAIWDIVREHIAQRPLFGSGYSAYWAPERGRGAESAVFVKRLEGFYPGSAHNGYLEVTNDLGAIGLLALSGYLIAHVRAALRCSEQAWTQALLCLAIWLQQSITNFSESHWLNVTSVDFVWMSAATFTLARLRTQREFLAAHGPLPAAET